MTSSVPQGPRAVAKLKRRHELLDAAAGIIADKGFHAMTLEDLGEAVGISGPAVYRHFSSKQAILVELLTGVSERLLATATRIEETVTDPARQLELLIEGHIDFALSEPVLIRLQNRELYRLDDEDLRAVRTMQGRYLGIWSRALVAYDPSFAGESGRAAVLMVAGLLNSTEHVGHRWDGEMLRVTMTRLACGALGLSGDGAPQHPGR
ncbi:TetR/AcrR family transcriptional regulator [Corynebacterium terpenotabidum]|uniref:TetR family transcriptional regulator n=1 Tax=Corynebacterium terpenotabidum Y-11 TaxID=1200352 RepID=S4XL63_9CORY|nr:TetR/AcrR family transcriptional regulator [Corynebacterium terpenotabidum]AGP31328.1 TetR family transcriptional regulator [Corynebacterium terpenotabidum Y-11]